LAGFRGFGEGSADAVEGGCSVERGHRDTCAVSAHGPAQAKICEPVWERPIGM
jgi:hypothetical protein